MISRNLIEELQLARRQAAADELEQANRHVEEALSLLSVALERRDSTPLLREAYSYATEARFAVGRSDGRQAVVALDRALQALETPAPDRPRLQKTLATLQGHANMFVWLDTSGDHVQCSAPLTEEAARAEMKAVGLPELEIEIRIASALDRPAFAMDQTELG